MNRFTPLSIFTECELVEQKHQGREIYYQLQVHKMKEIDKWLEQFRQILGNRFNELDKVKGIYKIGQQNNYPK